MRIDEYLEEWFYRMLSDGYMTTHVSFDEWVNSLSNFELLREIADAIQNTEVIK